MLSSITIFIFLIIYYKKTKKIDTKTISIFLIIIFIPYFFLQMLVRTDKLYYIKINSNIETRDLSFKMIDNYIGEKDKDNYIIYQEDKNLIIPDEEIIIENIEENESNNLKEFIETSKYEIQYNNKFFEFLSKDYFYDNIIQKYNTEFKKDKNIKTSYILKINDKNLIKN